MGWDGECDDDDDDDGLIGSISRNWRNLRWGRHLSRARNRVVLLGIAAGWGRDG